MFPYAFLLRKKSEANLLYFAFSLIESPRSGLDIVISDPAGEISAYRKTVFILPKQGWELWEYRLFHFFRFHAAHMFFHLFQFVFLVIFLKKRFVFRAVRWVDSGVVDMDVHILFRTLH